ncbi:MAG: IscS subfamily cysteine desulfurase [Chloroflexi bacterium]|nr:IscS subfamily cysteine desulfurase [Chloroflexota bacterium]MBI3931672.1 IscS subfamily cysteine desulfurase [Chloroflexota bacterium]
MNRDGWVKGLCGICPAGCWVEVLLDKGRLVDIRPDGEHTLGMLCRRGKHSPEIVYSEHRLRHPLRRVGAKGSYQFERITWDEAYGIITEKFNQLKKESGPETVAIYTGRGAQEQSLCDMFQPKGVTVSSASNVLFPFGSPNTTGVGALCYVSLQMIAPHVTMGRMQTNMFTDIENAGTIFVWGTNPATDSPPADMRRLEAAARRGAEIIVIDPRRNEAAIRTNARWVPVRPGTDGALALSMIEVMIDEDLYDEDFAENWCHGFEELKTYTQHFSPEVTETITGVPAETIRELAHRIASAVGASLLMYTGLEYSNSGVQSARAILTLFALAGQLDVPGGIGLDMLGSHFQINHSSNLKNPDLELAIGRKEFPIYTGYREESHAIALVDSVLHGQPYPVRSLLIHGSSMLTSWPQTSIWRETLARLDFLVCIDRQMTADAAYADIMLPATTMFENYSYMVYGPIFRLRERIIEPVGEARNDYLIMAELARHLGYGHLFPQTEEAMIRLALDGSGYALGEVKAAGGWVRIPTAMMEYKKWQKGSLRPDGKPGFDTPSGKFEIWSTTFEEYGYEPLPKYIEPTEGPLGAPRMTEKFPLVFNSGARPQTDFRSQHHGIAGLVKDNPEPTVDINIQDAEERGIVSGDLVRVSSPRGSVSFRARVTADIMKGAVECMFGGGTPVGPKEWQERNVNELTDLHNYDRISGFPVYKALLCEVAKVAAGTEERRGIVAQAPDFGFETTTALSGATRSERLIYLDNNATTEVAEAVREAMMPYLGSAHGNPSSIYEVGRDAREAVETARRQVAKLINSSPRRIIFSGGGSEADNLALKGTAFARRGKGNHIITTTIEHPAILSTCHFLEKMGYQVTYLNVDENGWLAPSELKEAIRDDTILVSIMMANNEVGTILPIRELAAMAHQRGILFHTDAVQAVGKIRVDVEELGVDMLSLSAHKFHGPKGIGALYIKKGLELEPLVHGGKQENGLRAGTENVPAIVGLGKAAELASYTLRDSERMLELRDSLERGIKSLIPGAILNGHPEERLWNTLNMTLPALRGESVVIAMDQHGISLSSGSACKSGSPEPTHVLMAMGRTEEAAHCSVRFSLSRNTTQEEINETISALAQVLEEKNTVRLMPCK